MSSWRGWGCRAGGVSLCGGKGGKEEHVGGARGKDVEVRSYKNVFTCAFGNVGD